MKLGLLPKLGFQSFVDISSLTLTPTATAGTPAAGTFYSSIPNRSAIPDITKDLKSKMGVERVMIQSIFQLQNEFGSNGEPVWGAANDDLGLVRIVGGAVVQYNDNYGPRIDIGTSSQGGYVEITFYGTGLNILLPISEAAARSATISIDGGATSTLATGTSNVLGARNYGANIVIAGASGLALGVHTAKIVASGASSYSLSGFEVLNEAAQIIVNPGSMMLGSGLRTVASQQSVAYNSGFESGTLGTRGGRVLEYIKSDGTIGKAVTPTDATALYLTNTNHANEEIARTYIWQEFGAGRADDFSLIPGNNATSGARAFTSDDGTTTLLGDNVAGGAATSYSGFLPIVPTGTNNFMSFTFVGTGLDIKRVDNSGVLDTYTVYVDGVNQGTLSNTANINARKEKICSGLPYGTHVVRLVRTTAAGFGAGILSFIVYQPKTPALPAGAIANGAYNLMADFVANATGGADNSATGVLRKTITREMTFVGTFTLTLNSSEVGGWNVVSSTAGSYMQYSFIGTGFDFRFGAATAGTTWLITVDTLSNLSGFTTSSYGTGVTSFTASTGTLVTSGTGSNGNGVRVSGLTFGLHTVKIAYSAGASNMYAAALDIITPIHSHKSNLNADFQNTLPVGSQGIEDLRVFSPLKDTGAQKKNWVQANGIFSGPTTTTTVPAPVPDMSVTIKTTGNPIEIFYSLSANNNTISAITYTRVFVNGLPVGDYKMFNAPGAGYNFTMSDCFNLPIGAGTHKVDLYWQLGSGTTTAIATYRTLKVRET